MLVIGLDPSLRSTGIAAVRFPDGGTPFVERWATVAPPAKGYIAARLDALYCGVDRFIRDLGEQPAYCGVEQPIVGRGVASALKLAQAHSAVRLAAWRAGCREFYEVHPSAVKAAVGAKGGDKQLVADGVGQQVVLPPPPLDRPYCDDQVDAVAVALAARVARNSPTAAHSAPKRRRTTTTPTAK